MEKTLDKPKVPEPRNPYNTGRFFEDERDTPTPKDRLWEHQRGKSTNVQRHAFKTREKGAVSWLGVPAKALGATSADEPSRQEIVEHANSLADELGMSREQFYWTALIEFIEKIENERLTQEYNEAYDGGMEEEEKELLEDVKEYHRRRFSV